MATPRMRRINEVLREVIGAAIAELSDPRIGFVTVTSVETSPDLRAAKVHVSVLGSEEEREATLAGLRSSHGVLQSKIAAETRMKRTPTLTFHYDETVEQGMRISRLLEEEERVSMAWRRPSIEEVADRAARARPLPAHHPRGPRRRRARLAARHAPPARPARQGLGDVHGGEGVPAADRVPLPAAGGGLPRGAGRHGRPHGRLPRLRQHRPHAGRLPHRRRQLHDQHRPPPRQHPLRRRQPGRHRRLLHGGDRLRAGDRCSASRSPRDRLGALRRPGHRHRQVHVREHQRPHPPDRRRADRRRGRRRRDLPPPLRARADREAAPASPARSTASSATATSGSSSPTSPTPTTRRPAPARR